MEVDEQPTGVPDGWTVVSTPKAPAAAKGHDFKILGVNIHVPAEEPPRADSNILTVGSVGVAPEDALMAGQAGRAIVGAARAGGAMGGAAEAAKQAAPMVKYEATKTILLHLGVPAPFASMIAAGVSGVRTGGKSEPVASNVPPAGVETAQEALARKMATAPTSAAPPASVPVAAPPAAGPVAPGPQAAPTAPAAASAPMPAAPPSGPTNTLPDQKALNEAALARRRADYQASQAAQTPPPAPAKPKLTNPEMVAFLKLIQQGKTPSEAYAALEAQRAFQSQFGLSTPTADQTRFQKGNRGGRP